MLGTLLHKVSAGLSSQAFPAVGRDMDEYFIA
jgi:hypothetical protein